MKRTLFLIWLAWSVILLVFQGFVADRLRLERPDFALGWTAGATLSGSQADKPYLLNPFLNAQVSWDSEFYLSIATVGYDDPAVRSVQVAPGERLSLNYAFYPLYPLAMRLLAFPLRLAGMGLIPAATLAGVLVSLLGTLAGMVALYEIVRAELGDEGGLRSAFYLLIFPSGFFLAQVYTEGLFIGLAFGCLALLRRRQFLAAGLLAALATWTRAVGVLLVIPVAVTWLQSRHESASLRHRLMQAATIVLPIVAWLVWNAALGTPFHQVEEHFFSRGLLLVSESVDRWSEAFRSFSHADNPQTPAYYALEFGAMALAFAACLFTLRRYPGEALFGLAVLVISFGSGIPQSMIRYVLAVPSLFIFLARLGKRPTFDRTWTVASVLLLGLLATLFTFDMWVG
jgi:hypothetical protein